MQPLKSWKRPPLSAEGEGGRRGGNRFPTWLPRIHRAENLGPHLERQRRRRCKERKREKERERRRRRREQLKARKEKGKKERGERRGGGDKIFAHLAPVEMLRSQTHDKGRESKGGFTRCVDQGVHREDLLVLELVATARRGNGTFLLARRAARASAELAGRDRKSVV